MAGRPCQQLGTPAPLHVEQDLAVRGRLLQVSREDAFLVGRFCGFSKPSQDFLLCYAQHSCGVLIFLAKIISFRLRGLGSLLFNDVV